MSKNKGVGKIKEKADRAGKGIGTSMAGGSGGIWISIAGGSWDRRKKGLVEKGLAKKAKNEKGES